MHHIYQQIHMWRYRPIFKIHWSENNMKWIIMTAFIWTHLVKYYNLFIYLFICQYRLATLPNTHLVLALLKHWRHCEVVDHVLMMFCILKQFKYDIVFLLICVYFFFSRVHVPIWGGSRRGPTCRTPPPQIFGFWGFFYKFILVFFS